MIVSLPFSVQINIPAETAREVLAARLSAPALSVPARLDLDLDPQRAGWSGWKDSWAVLEVGLHRGVLYREGRATELPSHALFSLRLFHAGYGPFARIDLWGRTPEELDTRLVSILRKRKVDRVAPVFSVESYVTPGWSGKGLGTELYAVCAKLVASVNGVIVPDVWTGSTTSNAAQQVWAKLARRDDLSCTQNPNGFVYFCRAKEGY